MLQAFGLKETRALIDRPDTDPTVQTEQPRNVSITASPNVTMIGIPYLAMPKLTQESHAIPRS